MLSQIYRTELQLNKTSYFDTEAPFLDFDLSIKVSEFDQEILQ